MSSDLANLACVRIGTCFLFVSIPPTPLPPTWKGTTTVAGRVTLRGLFFQLVGFPLLLLFLLLLLPLYLLFRLILFHLILLPLFRLILLFFLFIFFFFFFFCYCFCFFPQLFSLHGDELNSRAFLLSLSHTDARGFLSLPDIRVQYVQVPCTPSQTGPACIFPTCGLTLQPCATGDINIFASLLLKSIQRNTLAEAFSLDCWGLLMCRLSDTYTCLTDPA